MPARAVLSVITRREAEVLNLLSRGFSNAEIATTLKIETTTVKHVLCNATAKLLPADSDKNPRVTLARLWNFEMFRIGAGRK
jgi:DNA-binding NarL/FixJ family response regulator